MSIAEGVQPVYVIQAGYVGVVNNRPELPQFAVDFWGEDQIASSTVRPTLRIPVPSPSDAATWALVAADLFRESAILSARVLDPNQCDPTELAREVVSTSGERLKLMDSVSATLTDAVTSMLEAAEKAQTLTAASAAAKFSTAPDVQTATISSWRDRHDSRLESASIFVPVEEEVFEQRRAMAVWEMRNRDIAPTIAGDQEAFYYTTYPELPQTGYEPYAVIGWIYPYLGSATPGLEGFVTYTRGGRPISLPMRHQSLSEFSGVVGVRREGDVYAASGRGDTFQLYRAGAGTTADPYRYRYIKDEGYVPSGWTQLNAPAYFDTMPFDIPHQGRAKFPVVTATLDTEGAKRAEKLLRGMRIDPRITPARAATQVANDVLYAMQSEYEGLYTDMTTGLELLATLGITMADLTRAAMRIAQVAGVLGQAIVDDPAWRGSAPTGTAPGRPKRVFGTQHAGVATDPGILYARTAGSFKFPIYLWAGYQTAAAPSPAYARSSVISAVDYVRSLLTNPAGAYDTARYDNRYTQTTHDMLRGILAWGNQHLGPRVRLEISDGYGASANQAGAVAFHLYGLGYTNAEAAKAEVEAWLGEEGYECAMTRHVGGEPCLPDAYRLVPDQTWSISGGALVVRYTRWDSPTGALHNSVPLFVTQTSAGKTKLLSAAKLPSPGSIWMTPYGDYTAKVLGDALAADPEAPEKTALSCAGIPLNVKVKLEDELTEAVSGKDGIESSFAHYLRKARDAATRADDLGDQLVQQGLQMDMRVEEARDGLEDLCGGVINVGRLESFACDGGYDCDLGKLLRDPSGIDDPQIAGDVEGLKRCLGVGDPAVNAVLGDAPVCVWTATHEGRTYPPCVAPPSVPQAQAPECIYVPGSGGRCPADLTIGGATFAYEPATNLNLSVSSASLGKSVEPSAAPTFACGNLLALRARHNLHPSTKLILKDKPFVQDPKWESFEWITQANLRDIAQAMGFEVDEYLFPTVTYGGSPMVSVGSSSTGPATPDASDSVSFGQWSKWPCSPHPLLNTSLAGHDVDAAKYCAPSTGSQSSLWSSGTRSLLCGGLCGDSDDSEQARAAVQAGALRSRLFDAVTVLKGISGASFRNVVRPASSAHELIPYTSSSVSTGSLPFWHPTAPGYQANRSADHSQWCWQYGPGNFTCQTRAPIGGTPGLRLAEHGWYGGYPTNPWFAWVPGTCTATEPALGITMSLSSDSCGSARRFLSGQSPVIRLEFDGCRPQIPDSFCLLDGMLCGEAIKENKIWDNVENHAARAELPSWVEPYMNCYRGLLSGSPAGPMRTPLELYMEAVGNSVVHRWCGQPRHEDTGTVQFYYQINELASYYRKFSQCSGRGAEEAKQFGSAIPSSVVLDALDLACAARSRQEIGCETLLDESYVPSDAADFPTMSEMVRCAADRVEGNLQKMLLPGLPKSVAEDIAAASVVQSFPENRGAFGQTVALLAGEVIALRQHGNSVVQAVRDLSLGLQRSQSELRVLGLERDIKDVELYIQDLNADKVDLEANIALIRSRQAISSSVTTCASALAQAAGHWFKNATGNAGGDWMAAGAVCSNTAAQVVYEKKIQDLTSDIQDLNKESIEFTKKAIELGQEVTDEQRVIVLLDASAKLNEAMDAINTALIALQASHARIQSYLAQLDGQRNSASRLAAKVLMLDSDELGRQYSVNTAMRARMNTLRVRYERARRDAIGAAYLARRGIEQKLGVDMSLMSDDMTGVEAPRKWVDKLCTLSGIDYEEIRTGGKNLAAEGPTAAPIEDIVPAEYDYSEGYVGDFVTSLENFVDAYRIDYPFQDGESLAVVSLRDEILGVRRTDFECAAIEGPNWLFHTDGAALSSRLPGGADGKLGWDLTCDAGLQVVRAPYEGPGPIDCAEGASSCLMFGAPKVLGLAAADVGRCEAQGADGGAGGADAPTEPPQGGLELWYRADNCSTSTLDPAYVDACLNLGPRVAGQDRTARSINSTAGVPAIRLEPQGIGGQPTLRIDGTRGYLQTGFDPTERDSFTISVVYRADDDAHIRFYNGNRTMPSDGRYQGIGLYTSGGGSVSMGWEANVGGATSARLGLSSDAAPVFYEGVAPQRGGILTWVVAAGPEVSPEERGTRLYVNGKLAVATARTISSQQLGGILFHPHNSKGGQLAEWLGYGRALTSEELRGLHGYLGERYSLNLEEPLQWVEGDEVARVANGGGRSSVSGFAGTADSIVDRSTARRLATFGPGGTANSPRSLSSFGQGSEVHYALELDGDDQVYLSGVGATHYRDEGVSGGSVREAPPPRDYLMTIVARVDGGSERRLAEFSGGHMLLSVIADTGVVLVQYGGTRFLSRAGVAQVGQPFVISVRGSTSEVGPSGRLGVTEVTVNGETVIAADDVVPLEHQNRFGSWAGIIGAMAEYRFNLETRNQADVRREHAALAEKYGIAGVAAPAGGVSPGFPRSPSDGPARLRQTLAVSAGSYWLSWYEPATSTPHEVMLTLPDGRSTVEAITRTAADTMWPRRDSTRPEGALVDPSLRPGWLRHVVPVEVDNAGWLEVAFLIDDDMSAPAALAGVQLEKVRDLYSVGPGEYFPTGASLSAHRATCEDSGGEKFRGEKYWKYGCEYYCPPGTGPDCAGDGDPRGLPKTCFYETKFPISLEQIEKGDLIPQAGFARGNFNYRFADVAVNVVGTAVKDCSRTELQSACYANNHVLYSLRHDGPFRIRNYNGDVFDASLYPGNVQQAQALLAERYITNPISSADRNLLSDYWRSELGGRPIDGNFHLRIYDTAGLNWAAVEDVQVVTRYRYWTRER